MRAPWRFCHCVCLLCPISSSPSKVGNFSPTIAGAQATECNWILLDGDQWSDSQEYFVIVCHMPQVRRKTSDMLNCSFKLAVNPGRVHILFWLPAAGVASDFGDGTGSNIFAWMWTVASMCWQLEELACRELERSVSCPWWFKRSKAWMSPPQPRSISKWPSQTLPTQWGLLQLPLDASQYLGEFAAKCAGSHFTGLNLQYLSQLPCLCPHVMLHSFGQILRCYHMLSPFSGLMWFGLRENAGHAGLCTFFWPPTNLQLSRPRSSAISAGPGLARVGVLPGWLPLDPQKLINCADMNNICTHTY